MSCPLCDIMLFFTRVMKRQCCWNVQHKSKSQCHILVRIKSLTLILDCHIKRPGRYSCYRVVLIIFVNYLTITHINNNIYKGIWLIVYKSVNHMNLYKLTSSTTLFPPCLSFCPKWGFFLLVSNDSCTQYV